MILFGYRRAAGLNVVSFFQLAPLAIEEGHVRMKLGPSDRLAQVFNWCKPSPSALP
jgi:hypothetical protein